jgi:hypothetical protein
METDRPDETPAIDPPLDPYDERPDRDPTEPVDPPSVHDPEEDPEEPLPSGPVEDPVDAPGVGESERRDPTPKVPPMEV